MSIGGTIFGKGWDRDYSRYKKKKKAEKTARKKQVKAIFKTAIKESKPPKIKGVCLQCGKPLYGKIPHRVTGSGGQRFPICSVACMKKYKGSQPTKSKSKSSTGYSSNSIIIHKRKV